MTRQQIDALRDAAAQLAHADGLGEAFEIATDDEGSALYQLFAALEGALSRPGFR